MPYIKIEAFDGNIDTFENYSETLEQYFLANDIDERKRAPALLSGIGAKTYQLLRSLLTPDLPSTKSYEELKQITNEHLSPKPLEIAKRFRFQKRNQREGESIQTYCAEIKRLTQHCGFAQALDKAIAIEMAMRDATELNSSSNCTIAVHAVKNVHTPKKISMLTRVPIFLHVTPAVTDDNEERPIAYASRTRTKAERNCSQVDKEALSIVWGVKKFFNYVCGCHFTIITDHQPLKYIFNPSSGIPAKSAARQQRYAAFLSGFDYSIEYRNSKRKADSFSRLPLPTTEKDDSDMETMFYTEVLEALPVSSATISKASRNDSVLSKAIYFTKHGWPTNSSDELRPFLHRKQELSVHQDCLLWGTRVIVPQKLQQQVLHQLHDGHLGIVKMKNMARGYFWWPGLDKDIEVMAKQCSGCMLAQPDPQQSPLHPWTFPDKPWHRIHIDYAGPFQNRMFLVVIDAHSKWAEVIPSTTSTSSATIDILYTIFARFGLPKQLVSDNAPQFSSDEFQNFLRANDIRHITGAPYHPSTNGLAERFVCTFKNAMKSAKSDHGTLHSKLSRFLLAYRNSTHATTGETPAKLLLGRNTRNRLDILKPSLTEKVIEKQSDQVKSQPQGNTRQFDPGETVLTRDYRADHDRWTHGRILSRAGPLSYRVETSPGVTWKRHADQIIHTNTEAKSSPAAEPDPQHPISPPPTPATYPTSSSSPSSTAVNTAPPHSATPIVCSPTTSTTEPRRSNRVRKCMTITASVMELDGLV
ncbi:hypothetical protein EGW08_004826 [Elysia chlorotica]|uniref:Integrase catalytic domain-containing protein n=1 Tax=Elysia chlorotica TaxID=188477 RepID=A0A433U0Q4_ELYCH|nr:hypothetical protein EGW08_004826 [Elysia chlorotica]